MSLSQPGFLRQTCRIQDNIGVKQYLFGFKSNAALNQILLEFKKEVFYNFDGNLGLIVFFERIIDKIRRIMIKEKICIKSDQMYDQYIKKWDSFTAIYDFRGPDLNIV